MCLYECFTVTAIVTFHLFTLVWVLLLVLHIVYESCTTFW